MGREEEEFDKYWEEESRSIPSYDICQLKEVARAAWQAAQPQWQPIETAPRNGSIFLIVDSDGKRYTATYNGKVTSTHWMPLPPPPQQ